MDSGQIDELIARQNVLKERIQRVEYEGECRYIAGADLTVEDETSIGCFVVIDTADMKPVYSKCSSFSTPMEYISGLLSFREGPVVLDMYREWEESGPSYSIDVLLVDGCGEWHPRGFGLACYVGVMLNIPVIGISKAYLVIDQQYNPKSIKQLANETLHDVGAFMTIEHAIDGSTVQCGVLRTSKSTPFKPVYVSIGSKITLAQAVALVAKVSIYREPEPLRLADRISRQYVREHR